MKVTDENGFLSRRMMIKTKNIIMEERIWINRVISEIMFSIFAPRHCTVARRAYHYSSRGTHFARESHQRKSQLDRIVAH